MPKIIHARLDDETDSMRRALVQRLGWTDSRLVREGIRSLSVLLAPRRKREFIGQGEFASGIEDLGSDKKHLEGFGG